MDGPRQLQRFVIVYKEWKLFTNTDAYKPLILALKLLSPKVNKKMSKSL